MSEYDLNEDLEHNMYDGEEYRPTDIQLNQSDDSYSDFVTDDDDDESTTFNVLVDQWC